MTNNQSLIRSFRLALELNNQTPLWDASHLFRTKLEKASPEHGIAEGEIRVEFYDSGKTAERSG